MAKAGRHFITRRDVIAASAVIPAAIGDHRRAYADLLRLFAAQQAADTALRHADDSLRPALAAHLARLCEAEGPLGRVEMAAADRLARTVPQSLAGAAAALRYVRQRFERDDYAMYEDDGYRALLFSTERAICRAIGQPA